MLSHLPTYGRQLRLFLADGTSSGPRFIEIFNRTIQALGIPANRIQDAISAEWPEFQTPGVYLVTGVTDSGAPQLYIGKGENVAKRVQDHPESLDFEITALILFTSKDANLNGSQVGWLESALIRAGREAKRISLTNVQAPTPPSLSKPELATVSEFFEDLKLIAQTAGFDYFSAPKQPATSTSLPTSNPPAEVPASLPSPEFVLRKPNMGIFAQGLLTDEGFLVKAGSDVSADLQPSFVGAYADLRKQLEAQGVIAPTAANPSRKKFSVDFPFSASSKAAAIILGHNASGPKVWKTTEDVTLEDHQKSLTP